jgi:hypothetical protein
MEHETDAGKRPLLRIIPKAHRPWRVAWRETWTRVQRERKA